MIILLKVKSLRYNFKLTNRKKFFSHKIKWWCHKSCTVSSHPLRAEYQISWSRILTHFTVLNPFLFMGLINGWLLSLISLSDHVWTQPALFTVCPHLNHHHTPNDNFLVFSLTLGTVPRTCTTPRGVPCWFGCGRVSNWEISDWQYGDG